MICLYKVLGRETPAYMNSTNLCESDLRLRSVNNRIYYHYSRVYMNTNGNILNGNITSFWNSKQKLFLKDKRSFYLFFLFFFFIYYINTTLKE